MHLSPDCGTPVCACLLCLQVRIAAGHALKQYLAHCNAQRALVYIATALPGLRDTYRKAGRPSEPLVTALESVRSLAQRCAVRGCLWMALPKQSTRLRLRRQAERLAARHAYAHVTACTFSMHHQDHLGFNQQDHAPGVCFLLAAGSHLQQ